MQSHTLSNHDIFDQWLLTNTADRCDLSFIAATIERQQQIQSFESVDGTLCGAAMMVICRRTINGSTGLGMHSITDLQLEFVWIPMNLRRRGASQPSYGTALEGFWGDGRNGCSQKWRSW